MIYKTLGKTGLEVSVLSFGAATLGDVYGALDLETSKRTVRTAVDAGINLIDTSPYYGITLSEERLGEALRDGYREKVILATKCGRYGLEMDTGFDFSAERLQRSVEESLKRLQTDVIDIFQLHDIEFGDKQQIIDESLPTLYKLKEQGKVRFIGITGYPVHLLRDVAEQVPVDTILSYCHYNLMNTTLDTVLRPFAEANNIGLINASTLHMGILTEQGPPSWHPAPQAVKQTGKDVATYVREQGGNITRLALQFVLNYDPVASTLVGMRTPEEVEQNLAVIGTQPDPELLAKIQEIIAPVKDVNWMSGRPENFEPNAQPPHIEG